MGRQSSYWASEGPKCELERGSVLLFRKSPAIQYMATSGFPQEQVDIPMNNRDAD